jgi:hypothetical protein
MAEYIERSEVLDSIDEKIVYINYCSPYQNEIESVVSGLERARDSVEYAPAADVVEVVRCKDCKRRNPVGSKCLRDNLWHGDSDFCSYGERKEQG